MGLEYRRPIGTKGDSHVPSIIHVRLGIEGRELQGCVEPLNFLL